MSTALDTALGTLAAHRTEWARLPLGEKIRFLGRLRRRAGRVAAAWVEAAARAKGLAPDSPLVGEEWISGPYAFMYATSAYEETLRRLSRGRDLLAGFPVHTRPDGRVAVRVYPADLQERLLLGGLSAEVWMQPGVDAAGLRDTMASFYREERPEGLVALVLGAGNIAAIPVLDLLGKLFVDGAVALVKLNPVNAYLGEYFEDVFAPLVDAGYVRFAYGGADVGAYLTRHPAVETVHVTGSARTHDAIVYGRGEEGLRRKAEDRPLLDKPVTSELGGVGPTIVVPGDWSDADLRFQAEHVVSQKLHNAGFNCIASQVLVLPRAWSRRDDFLAAIRAVAARIEPRSPYYPGAAERHARVLDAHPRAELLADGEVPFTLVAGLDPDDTTDVCFQEEVFGPVLATTALPGDTPEAFLTGAVAFANDILAGTLGANLIVDPATARRLGPALDGAISSLRYGTIAVDTWTGVGFLLPRATWGAFPGHPRHDIGSGRGVVHNALMFGAAERTVLRGPFAPAPRAWAKGERHLAPRPPYFVTHRRAGVLGARLARYAVDRSWRHFPGLVSAAFAG